MGTDNIKIKQGYRTIPKYGDCGTGDVKKLQQSLKERGYYPGAVDDWFGDATLGALIKFQKDNGLKGTGIIPADGGYTLRLLEAVFLPPQEHIIDSPPSVSDNFFGAPWVGANIDLLGRDETDPELNARYVPEWALEGLPQYTTLAGNKHAWCSLRANADRRKVGIKGTNSAAASSWSKWGRKSPYWFGAALDILHKDGGRHVCDFLYWIDESKRVAATLDGNRGNKFAVCRTDLSGKGDIPACGPRWSNDLPDGEFVTMERVLKKYPFLKIGEASNGQATK